MFRKIVLLVINFIMFLASLRADFNEKIQLLVSQKPPKWMLKQIEQDFSMFKERGISREAIDQAMSAPGNEYSVRYRIQSQQVSATPNIETPALQMRRELIIRVLNKLAQAVKLPDVEIIISSLDTPYFCDTSSLAPVFVFSKNKHNKNQVLIPDLDALQNYGGMGKEIEVAGKHFPWKIKESKVFWRGATTGGEFNSPLWQEIARAKLVLLSLKYPKDIDAKFTQLVQGAESNPAMLAIPELKGESVTQTGSLKYKYLIDVDGNTCSWQRVYWILLSNSVLLKQVTDNIEWYYGKLVHYKHFIPIKEDLSDLIEKINWARNNDSKAQRIAQKATRFIKKNLSEEMIYLYLYWVLMRYAELQTI